MGKGNDYPCTVMNKVAKSFSLTTNQNSLAATGYLSGRNCETSLGLGTPHLS